MCVDWTVRQFWAETVPTRRGEALTWAQRLRAVVPIVDKASAEAARTVAREAQAAANAAAYAAANARTQSFTRSLWDESLAFLQQLIDADVEAAAVIHA